LQYVSEPFIGAFVLHPQRMLQSPLLRPFATEAALQEAAEQAIDPRLVRQVVVLFSDPTAAGGARLPAAVVRFARPVSGGELLSKALQASELRNEGGISFLVSPTGQYGGFQPDPLTLVVGPPELLPAMAAARNIRTPLTELVAKLNFSQEAAGGFVLTEGMRGPANALIDVLRQGAAGNQPLPAEVSAAAQGLPARVQSLKFAADLRGRQLLELSVSTSEEQAASNLQTVARHVLDLVQAQLVSVPGHLPPDLVTFRPLAVNMLRDARLQQRGAELVISFARPEGLEAAIAEVAERQASASQ
jgi:hypothetical protein